MNTILGYGTVALVGLTLLWLCFKSPAQAVDDSVPSEELPPIERFDLDKVRQTLRNIDGDDRSVDPNAVTAPYDLKELLQERKRAGGHQPSE